MATARNETKFNFASDRDTFQAGLMSVFEGKPEDTAEDLSKLFAPTFEQRAADGTRDLAAFTAHIRGFRESLKNVTITVNQFLRDGAQLADRHTLSATLPDGTQMKGEAFVFGEVAEDGRVAWISEVINHLN